MSARKAAEMRPSHVGMCDRGFVCAMDEDKYGRELACNAIIMARDAAVWWFLVSLPTGSLCGSRAACARSRCIKFTSAVM